MIKQYWMVGLPALVAGVWGCSGEGLSEFEEAEFGETNEALTLMAKPGTQASTFTEAGRDIKQVGAYTFYSAETDAHTSGNNFEGSVHLFKDGAPLRSYQARVGVQGERTGRHVGLSQNWAVTDIARFPVGPGQIVPAIMIIGKNGSEFASCGTVSSNGTLPNCVTCTGTYNTNESLSTLACTASAPGVQILTAPSGIDFSSAHFELEGNELLVATRDGGPKIAQLKHNGSQWVHSATLQAPVAGEFFGRAVAISGNRMAVSASDLQGNDYVYVYTRTSASAAWQLRLRINPPTGNTGGFGQSLDLSGTSLFVADDNNVHFIELNATNLTTPATALTQSCSVFNVDSTPDVAISGARAVVTTPNMPITFKRDQNWAFYGGLPTGIFPHDGEGVVQGSTAFSLWGAALDQNRAAIGWRNYRGSNANTETGAALGFNFDEYSCGLQMGVPGAGLVRARQLATPAVNAPNFASYPETNAVDGSDATRWMAPATGGTRFEVDLGEYRVLSHLQLNWGNQYARDYLIEINDQPDSVPANQRVWRWLEHVTNGDGGADFVNLRNKTDRFGRRVRLTMHQFAFMPGQTDQGVSLTELRAYGMVHNSCSSKPVVSCSTPATASLP